MVVVDEVYNQIIFQFSSEQLVTILQDIKIHKDKEINDIKAKIKKFEQTRRAHEVWYQSLSPVRKFFTGRPPSHHQAVEYIVNVKERFNTIEKIKIRISQLDRMISLVMKDTEMEQIVMPTFIIDDIKAWKEKEDRQV
jgi:acetyl-CoA carboxylase alpha subunit